MLMNLLAIIVFLLMFMVLVSVHEWGHYLFARLFNMGVSEFSIGMGRPIVKTFARRKYKTDEGEEQETLFNYRAWPLGGFVKIVGMEPDEDGNERNVVGGFYSKPPWQRIVVLLAGPIFSLAFGWVVLVGVFLHDGLAKDNNVVSELYIGEPAEKAGIKLGDRVLAVSGNKIENLQQSVKYIRASNGQPVVIRVERDKQILDISVTPRLSAEERPSVDDDGIPTGEYKRQPQVGMAFGKDHMPIGLGQAMAEATNFPIEQVKAMVARITQPQVIINNSTGVVGMAVITKEAVKSGLSSIFLLTGGISLSLGIFNLLPIGPLDGGQILLSLLEWIRRGKRISAQAQIRFFLAGALLMGGLFVFRFYKDIVQYVIPGKENVLQGTGIKKPSTTLKKDSNAPVK